MISLAEYSAGKAERDPGLRERFTGQVEQLLTSGDLNTTVFVAKMKAYKKMA